jgi:hypothetical protein
MKDGPSIVHIENVGPRTQGAGASGDVEIKVLVVTSVASLGAESKSLYITKGAADDLVQILGKYLLALD